MLVIKESQLGAHLDFRNGRSSPSRNDAGRYSVFGSNGLIGRADECNADAQTIIVGRVGTYCGSIHFSSEPCWVTDNAIVASSKKPEEARFWYLLLRAYDLNNHRAGSGQPLLNQSILNSIKVSIPEEAARLAIASVLGALDDKIELNRRMNETLEAMARAIFKDWFVDFGPTRAKMKGRAPYLAPDIWALFPNRLDDDGKPENWRWTTVGDISDDIRRGLAPSYIQEGGVLVLNQKCIRDRRIEFALGRRHDAGAKPTNGRTLKRHDVLINSTGVGTLGRASYVWSLPEQEVIVDSHVTVARPNTDKVSATFYDAYLVSRESEFDALGEGSTGQTELARARIASMNFLLPPGAIQDAFTEVASTMFDRIAANQIESVTLAATRDLLLPKLMSGEIRVRDAAKAAEAAI